MLRFPETRRTLGSDDEALKNKQCGDLYISLLPDHQEYYWAIDYPVHCFWDLYTGYKQHCHQQL